MIPTRNLLRQWTAAAITAAVPPNYSNIPYQKVQKPKPNSNKKDNNNSNTFQLYPTLSPVTPVLGASNNNNNNNKNKKNKMTAGKPSPMRNNNIDRSRQEQIFNINPHQTLPSFRHDVCRSTDVSMRPLRFPKLLLLLHPEEATNSATGKLSPVLNNNNGNVINKSNYGEALPQFFCRWAAKFYGQVTYGPRNYPYPSSRWLARRFRMKKHRIIKRFRFRRYKLAAVANLPFAKMIRVGMLPELKSSKTKKGDTVDMGLSQQLVSAAKTSAGGGASGGSASPAGKRRRPKSKYQV